MNLFSIIVIINYISFGGIVAEYLYSVHKKDDVYGTSGTAANIFTGLLFHFATSPVALFYLGYFIIWYNKLGYDSMREYGDPISFFLCLLAVDLCYYIYHRANHRTSLLWMFHHTHHSDRHFNMSTAIRVSTPQLLFIFLFFSPPLLLGFHPYLIFSAYYVQSVYQYFTHSQYLKLPLWLNWILVTPNNHRTHHDQEERHQNSNFGGVFSIWDRLFGTYTAHIDTFTPGIKGYHQDNVLRIQTDPIIEFFSGDRS